MRFTQGMYLLSNVREMRDAARPSHACRSSVVFPNSFGVAYDERWKQVILIWTPWNPQLCFLTFHFEFKRQVLVPLRVMPYCFLHYCFTNKPKQNKTKNKKVGARKLVNFNIFRISLDYRWDRTTYVSSIYRTVWFLYLIMLFLCLRITKVVTSMSFTLDMASTQTPQSNRFISCSRRIETMLALCSLVID